MGSDRTTDTSDRLHAAVTLLGEEFAVAVGTVRLVILRRELFTGQSLGTVRAREAVAMPRSVLVRDSTLRDHLTHTHTHTHTSHHPVVQRAPLAAGMMTRRPGRLS